MAHIKMLSVTVLGIALMTFAVNGEQPAFCKLPSKTGVCRAAFPRYFFDTATGRCRQFIYGGCGGNDNNFRSISECRAACTCTLDLSSGDRGCNSRSRRQYYYDSDSGSCKRFRYSGCGGNQNRFRSAFQCRDTCTTAKCYLPSETGRCKAYFERYFFNTGAGLCEKFVWGGCGGNSNNFRSKQTCEGQCASRISTLPTATDSPPTAVPGDGGQGGTGEGTGSGNLPPECYQPKVVGKCRAAFRRYYYNSSSGMCERFIYGGCQGNDNNFRTLAACEARCNSGANQPNSSSGIGIRSGPFLNGRPLNSTSSTANSTAPSPTISFAMIPTSSTSTTVNTDTNGTTSAFITHETLNQTNSSYEEITTIQNELPEDVFHQHTTTEETAVSFNDAPTSQNSFTTDTTSAATPMDNMFPDRSTNSNETILSSPVIDPTNLDAALETSDSLDKILEDKTSIERCQLPESHGSCQNYTRMFTFHWQRGRCKPFVYGGCQGNTNRFPSRASCIKICIKVWRESKLSPQSPVSSKQDPSLKVAGSVSFPRAVLPWFPSLGLSLNVLGDEKQQWIRYMVESKKSGKQLDMDHFRRTVFGISREKGKGNT